MRTPTILAVGLGGWLASGTAAAAPPEATQHVGPAAPDPEMTTPAESPATTVPLAEVDAPDPEVLAPETPPATEQAPDAPEVTDEPTVPLPVDPALEPIPAPVPEPWHAAVPPNLRIPRIPAGQTHVQPWVRSTLFTEWYRNNYNTRQSDDRFVSLVGRLGVGADTQLRRVLLGTQLRLDGQKIWFPAGQDCSGDCVPVGDDARLERVTVRADTRYVSVQAGDHNVSFGRGMGLSVRKIDLIGVDATTKGGRVDVKTKPVRMTASAGFANRQNSDFATRQLLEDPGYPAQSYTFSPRTEQHGCDVSGALDPEIGNPLWTVCSDLIAATRAEGTLPGKVDVGAHYVYLDFGEEATAGVVDEYSHLIGGDVGRMRVGGVWDLFVGASGILRNPNLRGTPLEPQSFRGHGVYASNVFVAGTTTVLVEAKHYRRYLLAFTQTSLLQYAENPTLEREDQQVPGNQNATGGRIRVDHTWRERGLTVYGNSLEYVYSDALALDQFGPEGRLATHNFAGIIWRKPQSDFVLQASGGYRHERYLEPPQQFALKRRFPHGEVYLSIPLVRRHGLTHALALRGEGRWENYRTPGSGVDFFRGLFTVSYSMSPWFSVAFLQGFDTERPTPPGEPSLTDARCQQGTGSQCRPHLWPGVQAQVNFFNASFLRVFAGRQYGGQICVNGSCRTLPDFEGVRTELVFSF